MCSPQQRITPYHTVPGNAALCITALLAHLTSARGQVLLLPHRSTDDRFTSISRLFLKLIDSPGKCHSTKSLRDSGREQSQQTTLYSITSSARASSVAGTSRPIALAVARFMTSSNLVDCDTGRSAGFAPLRMRPV